MVTSKAERSINLSLLLLAGLVLATICIVAVDPSMSPVSTALASHLTPQEENSVFYSARSGKRRNAQLSSDSSMPPDDVLDRAKALTSESTQSQALAKIAEAQAEGEEKLLGLKQKMLGLMTERASDLQQKAAQAEADVAAAQARLASLQDLVQNLQRQAHYKSVEAEQREQLAKKLFNQAKELGIEARAAQKAVFMTQYGDSDGPPAVSDRALALLKGEAVRMAKVLREDASELHSLKQAGSAPAAAAN